jgi:UPF0176 protein
MTFHVAAFYQFFRLENFADLQAPVLAMLDGHGIKGSVLLAREGINGTIAGEPEKLLAALSELRMITGIFDLEHKLSFAETMPFKRMKVRLKKEIVTIGNVAADPTEKVGTYVEAKDWNALISDPNVILIDTRNDYEFGIGTFQNAIDPGTERFGQFPEFVREKLKADKSAKIAMFCTGGIRCEKASSFMMHEGFESVYHLKGGILKYLEVVPEAESLWSGSCYVFDERVAVGHGLEIAEFSLCHGCMNPVSAANRGAHNYERGVCCPACTEVLSEEQKASNRERQRQVDLAKAKGGKHLGPR